MDKARLRNSLEIISRRYGGGLFFDEPLDRHNTMGVGGSVSFWYEPAALEELREAFLLVQETGSKYVVTGAGSNTLMPDGVFDAVAFSLAGGAFSLTSFDGDRVKAGAGKKLSELISDCCEKGLSGLEGLVGIPGTVGGALATNAGYVTTISDRLATATVLERDGTLKVLERKDLEFGYRRSSLGKGRIILEAVFRLDLSTQEAVTFSLKDLFDKKMTTQPLEKKTLGCIFKNPDKSSLKSWELIDMAGLRGQRLGGAVVSPKHANFIENDGEATAGDVISLMKLVQLKVKDKFGIDLEAEVQIIPFGEGM